MKKVLFNNLKVMNLGFLVKDSIYYAIISVFHSNATLMSLDNLEYIYVDTGFKGFPTLTDIASKSSMEIADNDTVLAWIDEQLSTL